MNKKIAKITILAMVVAAGISGAAATCIPAKDFGTWNGAAGVYYYVFWGAGSSTDPAQTDGRFWQPGNRAGANEGGYDVTQWLNYYTGYGWYLNGNLGNGSVTGCPAGQLVVMVTDPTPGDRTDFFVGLSDEDPPRAPVYWIGPNVQFQPLPSPEVTSSSRSGSNVVLDLVFADPANGFYSRDGGVATEAISSVVLYQAKGADPGRNASAWSEIGRFSYGGGDVSAPGFAIDCSDNVRTYLAAGLSLTGGEYDTVHVSSSVAVECDPNLADPDAKFDLIRERGKGQKRGKPFQN